MPARRSFFKVRVSPFKPFSGRFYADYGMINFILLVEVTEVIPQTSGLWGLAISDKKTKDEGLVVQRTSGILNDVFVLGEYFIW